MLSLEELTPIIDELQNRILQEITFANRSGNLEDVLRKYNFYEKIESSAYTNVKSSRIIVFGQTNLKKKNLDGIAKSVGISPERIDYISYDEVTNYDISNLQNNLKYSDILVGPVPHKAKGMGSYPSMISAIESNQKNYPNLIRVMDSNELKITSESYKTALKKTNLYNEIMKLN